MTENKSIAEGKTCGICHDAPAIRHQFGWGYLCENCDEDYHRQMRKFRERNGIVENGQTGLGEFGGRE